MKSSTVDFMQTVEVFGLYLSTFNRQSYGFSTAKLSETLANLFDSFTELMKYHCSSKIGQVIELDDFKAAVANNLEDAQKFNAAFKFFDEKKMDSLQFGLYSL
jgi:hypothetical protein